MIKSFKKVHGLIDCWQFSVHVDIDLNFQNDRIIVFCILDLDLQETEETKLKRAFKFVTDA